MTKIGTEVAHVTGDSDTTFKVKRSKVKLQMAGILWRPPAQPVSVRFCCLLIDLVTLSVPVQVVDWKDSSSK